MPARVARFAFVFGLSLGGIGFSGCTTPTTLREPKLQTRGELRLVASAGPIAVTVLDPNVPFQSAEPTTKSDATGSTAAALALDTLRHGGEAAMFFPATYVIGGVVGAAFGVRAEKARNATEAIARAHTEFALPRHAGAAVTTLLARSHAAPLTRVGDDQPMTPPRPPRGATPATTGSTRAAPHPLQATGIETLLAVRVFFHGFQVAPPTEMPLARNPFNPPLRLVLALNVTGLRTHDWGDLGGISFHYQSAPRTFTAWAADDAAALRRELAAALEEISSEWAARTRSLRTTSEPAR